MPAVATVRKNFSSSVAAAAKGRAVKITKHGRAVAAIVDIDTLNMVEEAERAVLRKALGKRKLTFSRAANSVWDLI